jgi:16S rRNA (cytosine1407-C5)-methyltransferase
MVIDKILEKYPIELLDITLPIPSRHAFTEYQGKQLNPELKKAVRIMPWEIDSDGFFLVKMRKIDVTESPEKENVRETESRIVKSNHKEIHSI